ncbi:MAG: YkoF family thiamine/hydroxymethylpyrimidine-binding protein [Anaerolineae bacterium]|jgi:uncharacterized protein YqgV (UPF0045/DUF77 family)|nr:hypothetical protein [Chloroflexota bacterium]
MIVSVQLSLYPLGSENLNNVIDRFIASLQSAQLETQVGSMSTVVWGESAVVMEAIHEAYAQAACDGAVVLQMTLSNACPLPSSATSGSAA